MVPAGLNSHKSYLHPPRPPPACLQKKGGEWKCEGTHTRLHLSIHGSIRSSPARFRQAIISIPASSTPASCKKFIMLATQGG